MPEEKDEVVVSTVEFSITSLLGDELLYKAKVNPRPTATLLQDKPLVALYFSASWCPPCKVFSPLLGQFYQLLPHPQKTLEIVYVSSDRSVQDFQDYYGKMPFLAIPATEGSAAVKNHLAQSLGIQGIPTLVVLDATTGELVTATARADVEATMRVGTAQAVQATVEEWKQRERVPLSQAATASQGEQPLLLKIVLFFVKRPMYIFGLLYFYKWMQRKLEATLPSDDGAAGGIPEDFSPADESEF